MKVTKEGKIKLADNDVRVGNFVASLGEKTIRLTDINENIRVAFSRKTLNGAYLEQAFEDEKFHPALHLEAVTANFFLSVPKDAECLKKIMDALNENMERHPEVFGKQEGTDEEHEAAAREVREMMEFEQEIKNLPDDGDTETR